MGEISEISISDYASIFLRSRELGIIAPEKFAIIPDNMDDASGVEEFLLQGQASTLKKLLREANVEFDYISPQEARYVNNKSVDWVAPTIFVGAAMWTGDTNAVSIALNVISTYVTDFFKQSRPPIVKLQVVVEKRSDRTCKKLTYEGDVSGLSKLEEAIRRLSDE